MAWSFSWRIGFCFVVLHSVLGWAAGYLLAQFGAWGAMDTARGVVVVVAVLLSAFLAWGSALDARGK